MKPYWALWVSKGAIFKWTYVLGFLGLKGLKYQKCIAALQGSLKGVWGSFWVVPDVKTLGSSKKLFKGDIGRAPLKEIWM